MFAKGISVKPGLVASAVAPLAQQAMLQELNEAVFNRAEGFLNMARSLGGQKPDYEGLSTAFSDALVAMHDVVDAAQQTGLITSKLHVDLRGVMKALRERTIDTVVASRDLVSEGLDASEAQFPEFAEEARNRMVFVGRMINELRRESAPFVRTSQPAPALRS